MESLEGARWGKNTCMDIIHPYSRCIGGDVNVRVYLILYMYGDGSNNSVRKGGKDVDMSLGCRAGAGHKV